MPTISQFYSEGWRALKGEYWKSLLVVFIFLLISWSSALVVPMDDAPGNISIHISINIILSILFIPMSYGVNNIMFLDICRKKHADISYLGLGYKDFKRILFTMLLVNIYTLLWTLLLFVPGVIKSISYAMTPFILRDNPELSYNAAIERSMQIMNGHKMKLFIIILIFWVLTIVITILTLGIGGILAIPLLNSILAKFYQSITQEE